MQCKLCLREKELIGKSHIVPDFMYKELFDEKHSLISFKTLTPQSGRSVFNGEYEGDILCRDCDNKIIGKLESYASQILYGGPLGVKMQNFIKPDGLEFTETTGLDYPKFKLFLLSVLWRASISNRPFFRLVSLGPYEEKIRQMILNGDAGLPGDFPCILISYRKRNFPKKMIMEPKKIKIDNKIGYHFLIGGISYMFKIVEGEQTKWVLQVAINEKGGLKVLHTTDQQAKVAVSKFFGVNIPDNIKFD